MNILRFYLVHKSKGAKTKQRAKQITKEPHSHNKGNITEHFIIISSPKKKNKKREKKKEKIIKREIKGRRRRRV
jgi:hypothetical protein